MDENREADPLNPTEAERVELEYREDEVSFWESAAGQDPTWDGTDEEYDRYLEDEPPDIDTMGLE